MKIVITDFAFDTIDFERAALEREGHKLVARQRSTHQELIDLVGDADCVITQFAAVNKDVVQAMRRARAIVRYGIGVDNVDVNAARAAGIPVCNIPDYCIDEVADHTLSFILALTRGTVANSNLITGGKWGLAWPATSMRALKTMTVGVIGFGRIGRAVCSRVLAFKARVLVYDPFAPSADIRAAGCVPVTLDELFAQSDLITPHCPSMPETRHIINRQSLAATKPGVMIVNVGRGDLADTEALTEALGTGHVAAAAVDVWAPEPIPPEHPVLKLPNVVFSAHIASVSPEAVEKLRGGAVAAAVIAARGELPPNVVNGVKSPRVVA